MNALSLHGLTLRASLRRLLVVTVLVFAIFSVFSPHFFTVLNFQQIALSIPGLALFGMAIMLSMLTGGIDLSIVSVANSAALTAAWVLSSGQANPARIALAVVAAIAVGVVCGVLNGVLLTRVRITPILATLGTMTLINGVDVGVTNGHGITGLPTTFTDLGTEKIAGVPFPFVVMLVIAFAVADLVNRSGPGLEMTLVGASFRASRYTGLSNARILVRTYVTCGVLSAMAGVIFAAINDSASPDYGRSYLLQAIVVAVLAGVNPDGGYATVAGVVLAATTIQMLAQGLQNWFPQQAFLPGIAQGLLLIMVMALDRIALGQRSLVLAELGRLRNRRRAAPSAPS